MHAVVCSTMINWAMHVVGDWGPLAQTHCDAFCLRENI
jgi:hypothetical protein